jgi:hypothetical protein
MYIYCRPKEYISCGVLSKQFISTTYFLQALLNEQIQNDALKQSNVSQALLVAAGQLNIRK